MRRILIFTIQLFIILESLIFCYAQDPGVTLRLATVNTDNINVRFDSNINSQIICNVHKGEGVQIVSEKYDWYKIKLPKTAALFVKKTLVEPIDEKTAKGLKDNINIRLAPNESSPILGKINKNEFINILQDSGEWYKIEPTVNSFGWIHKKFVDIDKEESKPKDDFVVIEGIIQPYGKVIKRIATHKLITKDDNIFLLKGTPGNLNVIIYHKVKITGKSISSPKEKYPVIKIIKIEVLD